MLPTTPRRRLPDGLTKLLDSSPPAFLSDAPDGLLENPPIFSTPLRPSIEQDNIQEDYSEEEWEDIDNDIDNLTDSPLHSAKPPAATTIANI
jgi:hypothetical protein